MPEMRKKVSTKTTIEKMLAGSHVFFLQTKADVAEKASAYANMLDGLPVEVVRLAIKHLAKTQEFFPAFSTLYKACSEIAFQDALEKSECQVLGKFDAWKECMGWMRLSRVYAKNVFVEMAIRLLGKEQLRQTGERELPYRQKDFFDAYSTVLSKCRNFVCESYIDPKEADSSWDFTLVKSEIDSYFDERRKKHRKMMPASSVAEKTLEERQKNQEDVQAFLAELASKNKSES